MSEPTSPDRQSGATIRQTTPKRRLDPQNHSVSFSRRGLHGQMVDELGRRIVGGALPPGFVLDLEGIAEELSVSRSVVREAVKVLTAKGMLDARPRLGTFVLARAAWNLLDADVMAWRGESGPDAELVRELEEVRQIVEPGAARLAAERRGEADLRAIADAMGRMRATVGKAVELQVAADLAFHRSILAAAHNGLLAQLEVVLEPALRTRDTLTFAHDHGTEYLDAHDRVYQAVRAARPQEAATAMSDLLAQAAQDTATLIERRAAERHSAP